GIVYTEFTTRAAIDIDNFIFRINSLANEPKRLSYVLMAAVVILLSLQKDYKLFFRKKWMLWGCIFLHVICTFWTYSTSIYISIAVFFGLMLVKSYRAAYHRYYYKISVLIVFGVVAILALSPGLRERLMLIYELRVESQLNQLEGDLYVRTEVDAIEYLKLHPYQAVLGLGPGNYNFAVEEAFGPGKGVNGGVLFALNSALLTLLMDFGIFGFILFGRHFFTHILDRPRYHSEIARKTAIPLIIFFFCVCITLNPLMIYFFFLGALDANLIREPITQAIT
ncbi:MAG: O-antigen ligase family protein, partial [Bacteroidota bacterium]